MHGALAEIERFCVARGGATWLIGAALSQADITVSCAFTFLREALRPVDVVARYPRLSAQADRCEALPAFRNTHLPFFTPGSQ